ncbi:T9SS type A sorting domain-containing protein [Paracrocinitomix mangrovi]|uniref:T9SS type A sorting domain-containing protein n=1 Tax=Paracrocinitomix mangrovi TaxID=2862509 RepID=UPI001C8E0654|nr:T9SS type A sorting domain-containing protein [Paracrocinitomix mangrovi]UKN03326.1 T9SS type A sorting domain-containing protein [Paracrocinitomix mangrovi]
MGFYRTILSLLLLFVLNHAQAQTTFATETFGTGAAKGTLANGFNADLGTWTVQNTGTNGSDANNWYVSGEECGNAAGTCGSACPGGDNSLHVSAIGGLCGTPDCGAAYNETSALNQTNQRAISPVIDCSSYSTITLNFNYIAAQGDDGFWVEYSTDAGSTWSTFTGGNVAATQCCSCLDAFYCSFLGLCCPPQTTQSCAGGGQGFWTAVSLSFPATADGNPNVRFAFHWSNDGNGFGSDPSVAIDDITLTYDGVVLSVKMKDFSCESEGNINYLHWTTLSESSSSHFEIEHSLDGYQFRKVGAVNAAGNSSSAKDYNFVHTVDQHQNIYRIKSVDTDGSFQYSKTITVFNDVSKATISHANGQFQIKNLENENGIITVYNLSGQEVISPISFSFADNQVKLPINNLKAGIYFVKVNSNIGSKKFKIVLQ